MKHYLWIIITLLSLPLSSCKESIEPFYSDNEQDRDDDEITGDDYVYHLPIIFHVLYKDQNAVDKDNNRTQYISYSRLKELLDNVNDLYEGKLYDYGKEGEAPSENIHVKFELAQYDESGKKLSTPGVEYIKYSGDYPIDCTQFMNQKKGKNKIIWDPNEYINVMVYNFKNTNEVGVTLGISNIPYTANGFPQIEGLEESKSKELNKNNLSFEYCVSLNSLYIYNESSRYADIKANRAWQTYSSADANVTLAHELGHYLGLHHTFSEQKSKDGSTESANNCDDTDYCTDTPSYNRIAYDNWLKTYYEAHKNPTDTLKMSELIKRSNDQGKEWDSDNFMDYSVSLSFRFTPEQRNRIRQVLYYSPLIPGPKKNRSNTTDTRSKENDEPIDLPIRLAIEKAVSPLPTIARLK